MTPDRPELLFSDEKGGIFSYPALEGVGMEAGRFFALKPREDLIALDPSAELFRLPERSPVGLDPATRQPVVLSHNPFSPAPKPCYAVAAFIGPGRTLGYHAAYRENSDSVKALPLFAYGACVRFKGRLYAAATLVDTDTRHDGAAIAMDRVRKGIRTIGALFPGNRLVNHLSRCALEAHCANAKNFFLSRSEAPLPIASACNSRCLGCISRQSGRRFGCAQPRIHFLPTAEELCEVAVYHLERARPAMVSFGQGCEGEPTLYPELIERTLRGIRRRTSKGQIHLNTNGSFPTILRRLFDAGLGSVRVSVNSFEEVHYNAYYRPRGYCLGDVLESIRAAKSARVFVSLNYLTMPGFTDERRQVGALSDFLSEGPVDMIQWRNLNYDPMLYFRDLKISAERLELMGVRRLIDRTHRQFPKVRRGYFNPFIGSGKERSHG